MKKASLLIATIMLSAGTSFAARPMSPETSFAQPKPASVRAQDPNVARDNKTHCERLDQTAIYVNNTQDSNSATRKGSAKPGVQ